MNINILFLWNSLHGFYEVPTFLLCLSFQHRLFSVLPLSDKIHHLVSTISYHLTSMGQSTWLSLENSRHMAQGLKKSTCQCTDVDSMGQDDPLRR